MPTVFAAVQLMVGASLLVGYRTRLMTTVGMFYLGALIVMGMIRYAPFLMGCWSRSSVDDSSAWTERET